MKKSATRSLPVHASISPEMVRGRILTIRGVQVLLDRDLATNGTAAIVCFPGIMYRGGAERKIRQYLVDNNYVDAVIQLPDNLFFGTSIATCIMVMKKGKREKIDIVKLEAELKEIVEREAKLRAAIDKIVAELNGDAGLTPARQNGGRR